MIEHLPMAVTSLLARRAGDRAKAAIIFRLLDNRCSQIMTGSV